MNRIEFQEWLNRFDEDTVIECVMHTSGHGYYDQGGNATTKVFNPDMLFGSESKIHACGNQHFDYSDFTTNQFVREGQPHFGKKILLIGGYDV